MFREIFNDGRTSHTVEKRFTHKNGGIIWVSLSAVPIRNDRGDLLYIQAIVEDITQRKADQEKLLQSEERFRMLVESAPVAISVIIDGKAVYSNKVFAKMLGYDRFEEFIGMDIMEHIAPESRSDVLSHIRKRTNGETAPSVYEIKAIRKNGEVFPMLTRAVCVQLTEGIASVGFFTDLTDYYKMNQNLKVSEERLRLVIEGGNIGFWDLDIETGRAFRNKQWSDMLGLKADETDISYDNWLNIIHPDDRDGIIQFLNGHKQGTLSIHDSEYRILNADGSCRWIHDRGMIIKKDENGKPLRMCGIVLDITDRKQAEARLKQYSEELCRSNESKDKLFSILSHDLKSPFSGFLGLSKELAGNADEMEKSEISEIASVMYNSSVEMFDMLTKLLDWSRLQSGRYEFQIEEVEPYMEIESLRKLFNTVSAQKSICIKNNVSKSLILKTDRNAVTTVLRNLIDNALKFTETDGTVTINSVTRDNFAEISVIDSGIGLNQETIKKLFSSSSGFSSIGTAGEKGSGLGLQICKDFIYRLGGEFTAGNNETGRGSKFSFTLPLV